jgi:hypothetical protein
MPRPKPIRIVQMNLRVHEDLRDKIKVEADQRGHSINREMERRLEESLSAEQIQAFITDAVSKSAIAVMASFDPRIGLINSQLNWIVSILKEKFDD